MTAYRVQWLPKRYPNLPRCYDWPSEAEAERFAAHLTHAGRTCVWHRVTIEGAA